MGGDHGHGHHEVKIPDYRIYKVEDAPELMAVQKALAAQGLKDPWIRNEVWRYNRKEFGSESTRIKMAFRGFKFGFAAFVVTALGTYIYDRVNPSEHGHGHH